MVCCEEWLTLFFPQVKNEGHHEPIVFDRYGRRIKEKYQNIQILLGSHAYRYMNRDTKNYSALCRDVKIIN